MSNLPFTFDEETKSLYSLGTDFETDDFSDHETYSPTCNRSEACLESPRVPFDYQRVEYDYNYDEWLQQFGLGEN